MSTPTDPDITTNNPPPSAPPSTSHAEITTSLITRCKTLLSELSAFQYLLSATQRNPQIVEARSLRSAVLSELRTLEKLTERVHAASVNDDAHDDEDADADAQKRVMHALRSSNLPFYETVWMIAKRSCSGLVAFGKRFYWDGSNCGGGGDADGDKDGDGQATVQGGDAATATATGEAKAKAKAKAKNTGGKDKRKSVYLDIVADDGEEWVKVSTISETRLLFEMAKKGWEADSEEESDGDEHGGRTILQNFNNGASHGSDDEDHDEDEIELVKLARDMRKAASVTRVNYRHPRLRMVIPKITEGETCEIDNLLKVIRSYGVVVDCGETGLGSCSDETDSEGVLAKDLRRLLPTPFKQFTPVLNVDCTLLLAIVSDVSYFKKIPRSPSLHRAILRQLEVESQRPLLTTELWPAMGAHELVCTSEAARRMREIVEVIGTETEKKRAEIVMADPPFNDRDTKTLIYDLQQLSDHEIPPHWKLPIRIVDANPVIDGARTNGQLPPVAHHVTGILSDINYSVFLYGWATATTTISSNRTVVKQIEAMVEKQRNGDEDLEGPKIWVCDTARSLVGKERGRKD